MRFAEIFWRLLAAALFTLLSACGGGNSTEVTIITRNGAVVRPSGVEVTQSEPGGGNTTEIVVDSGPGSGFALSVANVPFVTVTVCEPGSASRCVTIDHVMLDTGSIGLRVLHSAVASLSLPLQSDTGGTVVECFPFVIGAVWGPLASADLRIGNEVAAALPIQIIDDGEPALAPAAPKNCQDAANGDLLASVGTLQAKGVLGVGMLRYDCGLLCELGDYSGGYTLYYRCVGLICAPLAVPAEQQVQNPVTRFAAHDDGTVDNNGTVIVLPALPEGGAAVARGRLIFGIGTQLNNQLPQKPKFLFVETDPHAPGNNYLYVTSTAAGKDYPFSYIDSGSNGLFFDDPALQPSCIGPGAGATWYCPDSTQARTAEIRDGLGNQAPVDFSVANADVLFAVANNAFSDLGGAAGPGNAGAFVWGLPFFYGRRVHTAIWGQALAVNGPWYAF